MLFKLFIVDLKVFEIEFPRNFILTILKIEYTANTYMENLIPEKILGKKFVRGKPYYKVRWQGLSKDQSTWQPPTKLLEYKSMVNKYEVKNWGCPLDAKFFDPSLYSTKPTVQKKTEKKKVKAIKRERKKNEQMDSETPDESPGDEGIEQEQQVKGVEKNKDIEKKSQLTEKNISHLEIIDIESQKSLAVEQQVQQEIIDANKSQKIRKENQKNQIRSSKKVLQEKVKSVKEKVSDKSQITILQLRQKNKFSLFDTGTQQKLAQKQKNQPIRVPQLAKKQLIMANMLNVEILPMKKIHQITHIYHLEKMNIGNHLYLVEFQDKEMRKMTTKDLMEQHSQQFVSYLEKKYKMKYNS